MDKPGSGPGKAAAAAAQDRKLRRMRLVARARGLLQGVASQIGPGDLALDCGANLGAVTLPLAATGADVLAFEPDPVACAALRQAVADYPNVTLNQAAVGIAEGTATLLRDAQFDADPLHLSRRSSIVPGGVRMQEGQGVEVSVIDLPALLERFGAAARPIAFLKLDIEGAELDILTEMLRRDLFDHVRLTVAELHGYKFPHIRDEFVALRKTLRARYPETRVWLDWI